MAAGHGAGGGAGSARRHGGGGRGAGRGRRQAPGRGPAAASAADAVRGAAHRPGSGPGTDGVVELGCPPDAGAVSAAAGLRDLADHLDQALPPLAREVRALSDQAAARHAEREDAWAPVAAAVSSWCSNAEAAQDGLAPVASIKAAETWLKGATDEIRNERLAPLAEQAKSIWAMLRQESNVDLGTIRLAGSSTSRHVELDVSVDGAPGSALGVMSQGEVNALALSVFLPRARLPASPFRFLVIDDPVQAMDPAKVDGLARVLEKAAADRQVIVFTHDNRLAEAIRQLRLPAAILEVSRRPGSVVQVRPCLDPVTQALATPARWPPIARCRTMSPPAWFPGCAGPQWRPRSPRRSGGGSFATGAATPRSKLRWKRRVRASPCSLPWR